MMIKWRRAPWAAALMMPVAAQAQTQGDTLAIEHVTVIPMVRDTAGATGSSRAPPR